MLVKVITFGCKVNQFESQAIMESLKEAGHQIAGPGDAVDVCIVNTCAVTARAAYEARQAIRRVLKAHPNARIIATGCYAQTDPWGLMESLEINICIVGNDQKEMLLAPVFSSMNCLEMFVGDIRKKRDISRFTLKAPQGRTRAYLRIQDGCNAFCSYCIVPYARGPSRSLPLKQIVEQAERFRDQGVKEIVVTGIHVGSYGKDLQKGTRLIDVMDILTARIKDCRFRLSSIEPQDLTDHFIELAACRKNFCPHFHIPLQSGSNRILKLMGRRYCAEKFSECLTALRERLPHAAIGTDCMVGFPGEEPHDFSKTYRLIQESPLSYLHVFQFSKRPGTKAYGMKETVTKAEKQRRSQELRQLGLKKKKDFYKMFLGKKLCILVERVDKRRKIARGTTANYLHAVIPLEDGVPGVKANTYATIFAGKYENEHIIGALI